MDSGDCPSPESLQTGTRPVRHFWHVPLYSNALYLIAGNGLGAVLGFVFWAMAARFYAASNVGFIAAAISAVGLLGTLANLGLGTGLVRFLPQDGKKAAQLINFSLWLVFFTAALLTVIFLLGTGWWSPGLVTFRQNASHFLAFTLFSAFTAMAAVTDGVFIARRRAGFAMGRGLSMNVIKLLLVMMFATMTQAYGIFIAWGAALSISLLLGLFIFLPRLLPGFLPAPNLDWRGRGEVVRYSLVNNAAGLVAGLPGQLLPIILLGRLGAEANAFFFIAWQIMAALSMVPSSISTSLFAEGCHDENELLGNAWRSRRLAFAIMTPVIILLLFFADPLLRVFGAEYAGNSTQLLRLFSLSLLPITVNQVWFSVLRVHKRLWALTILNGIIALVTLAGSYLLLPYMGTQATGVGWLAGQTLVALWVVFGQGRGSIILQTLLPPARRRKASS